MGRLIEIDIFQKIKQLDQDKLLEEVWRRPEVQAKIIELNTIDQLFDKSERSDGELLPFYARNSYKVAKGDLAPTERINLRLSGRFYKTFEVIPNSVGFSIDADPNLYQDSGNFFNVYGLEILGLNEENTQELGDFIKEFIIQEVRLFIGLD